MIQIENREHFEDWLKDKPVEWTQALALRSAMRVLPIALDPSNFRGNPVPEAVKVANLRAIIVTLAARNCPAHHVAARVNSAAAAAYYALTDFNTSASDTAIAANAAGLAAYAIDAAFSTYGADTVTASDAAARAAAVAAEAAETADAGYTLSPALWKSVSEDCSLLGQLDGSSQSRSLVLLAQPLWAPRALQPIILIRERSYQTFGEEGRLWMEWYDRRFVGMPQGFDLPHEADLEIQSRLLDQDSDWWERGLGPVGEDIERWIEEQRQLLKTAEAFKAFDKEEALKLDAASLRLEIIPEQQFTAVPVFQSNEKHQLSLNFEQGSETLRTDEDAADRHAELLAELHQLKEQCAGSNSLGHVVNLADRLLKALGSEAGEMRTSLVVQRGERIRQLAETYENLSPTSLHEKVDEFVFNQLKATRDALNMVVGLDPVLDTLDRARLGPDVEMAMVSPSEVKEQFEDLADQKIVTEETREFVEEAVDLAPAVPDPENRQSRTVDLVAQNFVRYSIEIISAYPEQSAWVAAGTGVIAAATLGLTTTGGGMVLVWALAKTILKHEEKFRSYIGNSPANQANFDKLIVFLKSLPL